MNSGREIVFLRSSLGIGGGERWAIDAARALAEAGWRVRRVVGEADVRAFDDLDKGLAPAETPVRLGPVLDDRLRSLRSIVRLRRVARAFASSGARPDLVVLDGLPHIRPLLRSLWPRTPVLLYCHFPDGPAAAGRGGPLRRLYRRAIDAWEIRGLVSCDAVAANSAFTARALLGFTAGRVSADVIHPGVGAPAIPPPWPENTPGMRVLVAGRFDPDKRQAFALDVWAAARARVGQAASASWRLAFVGGCDRRRPASRAVLAALEARITAEGWTDSVRIVPEASQSRLEAEFAAAHCLLHPMPAEHFGIVPVEAMARGRPVLAVAGAGPDETVIEARTGALRPPTAEAFASVLVDWAARPRHLRALGEAARHRAADFSPERFAERWTRWVATHAPRKAP